jgi:hypothetical protein
VVRATSSDGSSTSVSKVIQVANVLEAPMGSADHFTTTYIDKVESTVLGNDVDPDGDALGAILVYGPGIGQLSFSSNGAFVYTPEAGYIGSVSFVYLALDGVFQSDPITVTIDIGLPTTVPGGNSGGSSSSSTSSTSSSNSNSGNTSSSSTTASDSETVGTVITPADTAAVVPTSTTSAIAGDVVQSGANTTDKQSGGTQEATSEMSVGELREGRAIVIGLLDPSSREYRARHFETLDRTAHSQEESNRNRREDMLFGSHYAMQSKERESVESRHREAIETVMLNTVVGTGLALWVVQGAQLAATLISVAPAWMHVDPLAMMSNERDPRFKKEELSAGEKLFDK